MIDMFTSYQNLSNYYIPNNLSKAFDKPQSYTKLDPREGSKPYELYNAKGELEGYYWYYGNMLNLEFCIDGELTVESNSIIYKTANQEPNLRTEGRLGQKIYNIADFKSWQCVAITQHGYEWQQDSEFTYPIQGEKVYVAADSYLADKTFKLSIYNFRYQKIYEQCFQGTSNLIVPIDAKLSELMGKGLYYCTLEVEGPEIKETLFSINDCKLLVK